MFDAPISFFDSMNFIISIPMATSLSFIWWFFMSSAMSTLSTSMLLQRAELRIKNVIFN